MTGSERRQELLQLLSGTQTPISGTSLAKHFTVSRQVIVQDIALLRAEDKKILSTYRGYVLEKDQVKKKKYLILYIYPCKPPIPQLRKHYLMLQFLNTDIY